METSSGEPPAGDRRERFYQIADAAADGEKIEIDALVATGEITEEEARALRALEMMRHVQSGAVAIEGEGGDFRLDSTRYEILKTLRQTGGSRLARASDRLTGEIVILKELRRPPDAAREAWAGAVARLRTLTSIHHDNIARLLAVDDRQADVPGGGLRIIMAWGDAGLIRTRAENGLGFSAHETARAARDLGSALAELHDRAWFGNAFTIDGVGRATDGRFIYFDYPSVRALDGAPPGPAGDVASLAECLHQLMHCGKSPPPWELLQFVEASRGAGGAPASATAREFLERLERMLAGSPQWLASPPQGALAALKGKLKSLFGGPK